MTASSHFEFPPGLDVFRGEIYDVDAHEAIPINLWSETFGSITDDLADAVRSSDHGILKAERESDETPIDDTTVWKMKMEKAPGAWDPARRMEVMDYVGVKKQLLYPGSMGVIATTLYTRADEQQAWKSITGDRRAYARLLHSAYNDWCLRTFSTTDRIAPVVIVMQATPDELIAETKRLLSSGARAIWIPTSIPLAGFSPAHSVLDPFWDMVAGADVPVLAHVGGHHGLLKSLKWREAEAFEGWKIGTEVELDPWTLSTVHLGVQTFLTAMVLGGVFERHPRLRFGANEFTGHWIGPMAENMDVWLDSQPFPGLSGRRPLAMKPSDYVRQNVRVSCFDFEPVGAYISRFGLEEVYCYASDFPHHEGGKDPMNRFNTSLAGHSQEVLRKFFIENGKWLLPS